MKITHKISMDLDRYSVPGFDAVWGDWYTRELEIALYAGGAAWEVPAEASVTVRYQKPDGTAGSYDLLPDGTVAWGISGNVVTVTVAPQALTAPGCVILTVCLTAGDREISTFQILMNVRPAVGLAVSESGDYWYLSGSLPQPEGAVAGEVLVVDSVDGMGRVTGLKTAGAPGVSAAQASALEGLLELAVFREYPTEAFAAFREAFALAIPATGITLSANILGGTAGYTKQLTAAVTPENTTDTVVWTSSDETVATVSDGLVTAVGEGSCTVTATAGAVSATCSVSVSAKVPTYEPYGVTYDLANASCSRTDTQVSAGSSFTAEITADEGYVLETVSVTMGGEDITSAAYADGVVCVASVTGDLVITVVASEEEHTHSYTSKLTAEATCTADGVRTYTCACGDTYTEAVPATGHYYASQELTHEATCTETGIITKICAYCGGTEEVIVPATGHNYVDGVCSVCGAADPDHEETEDGALLYNWDFTKSLTDTVSGLAAVAEVGTKSDAAGAVPAQDSSGVHFTGPGQAINFGDIFALNRTYEIDVSALEYAGSESYNMRFFTLWDGAGDTVSGFLYRHTYNYWSVYSDGWAAAPYDITDRNAFAGKTVTLKIAEDGTCELLLDGVSYGTCSQKFTAGWNVLQLGSTGVDGGGTTVSMGANLYNCTITGFRIYQGV